MPLSDHEQRILADIEARLRADDPRFVENVGSKTVSKHASNRLKLAVAGTIAGFALIIIGLGISMWVSLAGFGLTLLCVYQGLVVVKRMAKTTAARPRVAASSAFQRYLDAARRREDDDG